MRLTMGYDAYQDFRDSSRATVAHAHLTESNFLGTNAPMTTDFAVYPCAARYLCIQGQILPYLIPYGTSKF